MQDAIASLPTGALHQYFTPDTLKAVASHAASLPSEEVCGLIVRNHDGAIEVIESPNVAIDKQSSFAIDPKLYAAMKEYGKIEAIYHSHCSDDQPAQFGFDDIRQSKRSHHPYLLYHGITKEWDYFEPDNLNPFPLQQRNGLPQSIDFYLGWQWVWNRADCYTLLRNYYRGVVGIDLADYERSHSPKRQHLHPYKSFDVGMPEIDFVKLPPNSKLQNHDVMLMAIEGDVSHHCAIITDANQKHFIHHYTHQLSEKAIWGEAYIDNCTSHWRYRSLM